MGFAVHWLTDGQQQYAPTSIGYGLLSDLKK
jgi:hypothetical protein